MIIPENFSGMFRTSVRKSDFSWYEARGVSKSLENSENIFCSDVGPDEVAVFCSFATDIISMVFVSSGNQKDFDYQKRINDVLLIIPLEVFLPIPRRGAARKISRRPTIARNLWWMKDCFC
jgi:hypothetical protein